jgi:hypothetical protein
VEPPVTPVVLTPPVTRAVKEARNFSQVEKQGEITRFHQQKWGADLSSKHG